MKKILLFLLIIFILAVLLIFGFYFRDAGLVYDIDSFSECESQGFPVAESYPRQCYTPDGRVFIEEIPDTTLHPMIRVFSPEPDQVISSPLKIEGEARGNWFFEASFSIELIDANGGKIDINPPYIMTSEDWMTEDFVSFEGEISFGNVNTTSGTLILHKDNPSGLPEHDDQISIPVIFAETDSDIPAECFATGCSSQVCADEEVITTCEFLPEYTCYPLAVCERQPDGECGWTETSEFLSCMDNL